jgi:hypothetical protein
MHRSTCTVLPVVVLLGALLPASRARAEPASADGAGRLTLRVSSGAAVAWFHRSTSYRSFEEGTTDVQRSRSHGLGWDLEVAVAFAVSPALHVGLSIGYGQSAQTISAAADEPDTDATLSVRRVGPEVTFRPVDRFFVRGKLGQGRFDADPHPPTYDVDAGTVWSIGGEVGYAHPLGSSLFVEAGLGASAGWARDGEDGDFGRYEDRKRLTTIGLVASIAYRP